MSHISTQKRFKIHQLPAKCQQAIITLSCKTIHYRTRSIRIRYIQPFGCSSNKYPLMLLIWKIARSKYKTSQMHCWYHGNFHRRIPLYDQNSTINPLCYIFLAKPRIQTRDEFICMGIGYYKFSVFIILFFLGRTLVEHHAWWTHVIYINFKCSTFPQFILN